MAKQNIKFNRREFLRNSTITVGGLSTIPEITVAESDRSVDEFSLGEKTVIDMSITHPDAPDEIPRAHGDGRQLGIFAQQNRLFAIAVSPQSIHRGPNLLRTPREISTFTSGVKYKQQSLYERLFGRSIEGESADFLTVEDRYKPFELDLKLEGYDLLVKRNEEEIAVIPEKTHKHVSLPERTVTIPVFGDQREKEIERPDVDGTTTFRPRIGTKEIMVSPQLNVWHRGTLSAFGDEGAMVLPSPVPKQLRHIMQPIRNGPSAAKAGSVKRGELRVEKVSGGGFFHHSGWIEECKRR